MKDDSVAISMSVHSTLTTIYEKKTQQHQMQNNVQINAK